MVPPARYVVVLGLTVLTSLALGVAPTQAQVPPPAGPPPPPAPPAKGFILGRVVDASSGRPLGGAIVSLVGSGETGTLVTSSLGVPEEVVLASGNQNQVVSDSEGRFLFRSLGKGSYGLSARANGYAPGAYGQRRPGGPNRRVSVEEDQRVTDAVIRLWKYASVSGRLVDESGEPAVGASVTVTRVAFVGGRRRYLSAGSWTTDDRGQYRIGTLLPATYLIQVRASTTTIPTAISELYQTASTTPGGMNSLPIELLMMGPSSTGVRVGEYSVQFNGMSGRSALPPPAGADGRLSVYPTVFYPSATVVSQATPITVASGEERTGIDMQLRPVRATSVSGVVVGPEGPVGMVAVRLHPGGSEGFTTESGTEAAMTMTAPDGTFRLLGVPSGQYTLSAQRVPRSVSTTASSMTTVIQMGGGGGMVMTSSGPPGAPTPVPTAPTLSVRMPLTVGDADIKDLAVTVTAGARVSGRVEFAGTATPPPPERLSQLIVNLSPADGVFVSGFTSARVTTESTFQTMSYPPGLYNLTVSAPGPPWAIRAITVKGKDALGAPLELGTDDLSGVIVTFGDMPIELSGAVRGSKPTGDIDAVVVMVPANVEAWIENGMPARRARTIGTSTNGEYRLTGLLSGDYLVAAFDPETAVDLQDPQFVSAVARVGTRITLGEGEKKTLPLAISQIR
jgi:protocatechuate 3,4-dioxygenase beta subunit